MLVTATTTLLQRHPFSRSYGVNLPSSLTRVLSNTLVFSTCLPVSVCGTDSMTISLEDFLDDPPLQVASPEGSTCSPNHIMSTDFPIDPRSGFDAHYQQLRWRLGPCPSITDHTGYGISTVCPSATPFGLALGPTKLQRTSLPEEPLGFRWTGFSPVLALLMSASSLAASPPLLPLWLRPDSNAPLPLALRQVQRFGGRLEPPYIIGAERHSTSKLLRTL